MKNWLRYPLSIFVVIITHLLAASQQTFKPIADRAARLQPNQIHYTALTFLLISLFLIAVLLFKLENRISKLENQK